MGAIKDIITQIQTDIAELAGIRAAPANPPENISVFPFSVCYPETGYWKSERTDAPRQGHHDIVIEIHVARKSDLAREYAQVVGYCESVPNAIFKAINTDQVGGTIVDLDQVSYKLGEMEWGGIATLGYRFVIKNVLVIETVT